MRDLHSHISVDTAIIPAVVAADTTPVTIDLADFDSAELVIQVGIGGINFDATNKVEFKLTHSDDDSTYTAVEDADVLGVETVGTGGIIKSLIEAHPAADAYRVGYVGSKRYLQLVADFSGTHGSPTPLAAVAVKGAPRDTPAEDQV